MSADQNDRNEYAYTDKDHHLYGVYHVIGHPEALYEKFIEELGLSLTITDYLKRFGATTIGDLLDAIDDDPSPSIGMIEYRGWPDGFFEEILAKLKEHGYIR